MDKKLKIIETAPGGYYAPGMDSYNPKNKKMTEGREKSNVKPPYWECKGCKHRAPDHNFKHGAWWWKDNYCPKCHSNRIDFNPKRPMVAPATQSSKLKSDDKIHLDFIYNRLRFVYGENPTTDYMRRFKEAIERK